MREAPNRKHFACLASNALVTGSMLLAVQAIVAPASAGSPLAPAPPAAAVRSSTYRLGPGDKLRVVVFGVDALGGEFTVPGSGRVSLPLIGDIQATGMTATELQSGIALALKQGFVNNPKVNVEVLNYRPFYILGEVNKPGEYPYTDGLTVINAVARAEGFTYRARTNVFDRRSGAESDAHTEKLTAGAPVQPGDTIRIKERSF